MVLGETRAVALLGGFGGGCSVVSGTMLIPELFSLAGCSSVWLLFSASFRASGTQNEDAAFYGNKIEGSIEAFVPLEGAPSFTVNGDIADYSE